MFLSAGLSRRDFGDPNVYIIIYESPQESEKIPMIMRLLMLGACQFAVLAVIIARLYVYHYISVREKMFYVCDKMVRQRVGFVHMKLP